MNSFLSEFTPLLVRKLRKLLQMLISYLKAVMTFFMLTTVLQIFNVLNLQFWTTVLDGYHDRYHI